MKRTRSRTFYTARVSTSINTSTQTSLHPRRMLLQPRPCCQKFIRIKYSSLFSIYSSPFPSFLFPPFFLLFLPFFRSPGVGHFSQIELKDLALKCVVRALVSGVASYGALGHVTPRLPTISFLVHFRVNLTVNYPSIV